jgi:hypothetical protein
LPRLAPPSASRPSPEAWRALDLGAICRTRAGDQLRRFLLDPAEGRNVLVRADQNPGLAGTGLRRKVGLPFRESMTSLGKPASHVRGVAVSHRALQDRQCEPVDLEEDDAGASVIVRPPVRRAIRWTTLNV